ncbi:MAG: type II toxin-antitoxin system HicB family antitoxin [Candidatus Riflebacteria bacterium]|nr:type II toxin-antitoxin system HicB family antitoxin [Candidatus Riflebacteria bacterium]
MGFSVEVPDLPVCGTTGRTFEKAIRRAREAISLHLEALEEDGKAIPLPSARLEIRSDEPEEIVTFLAIQYWWAA